MSLIESQIEEIKIKATKNKIDEKVSKEEIDKLWKSIKNIINLWKKE